MKPHHSNENAFARAAALVAALIVAIVAPIAIEAQSPAAMADILKAPQNYWNKAALVSGHVTKVTPNPPGSTQGSYLLRDANGREITIMTSSLPTVGQERTVRGTVGQETPASMTPVIYEGASPIAPGAPTSVGGPMSMTPTPGSTPFGMPGAAPLHPPNSPTGFSTTMIAAMIAGGALVLIVAVVAIRRRGAGPASRGRSGR